MVRRTFIYGQFLDQKEAFTGSLPSPHGLFQPPVASPPDISTEAIEILREPSVLELIGKVYVLTANRNYQPVTPLGVRNFNWYEKYQRSSMSNEKFYFRVKDGDLWLVPWMRLESDAESASYIAVALKHD